MKKILILSFVFVVAIVFSLDFLQAKRYSKTTLNALIIVVDDYKVDYGESSNNKEVKAFINEIKKGAKDRKENLNRVNRFLNFLSKKKVVKVKKRILKGKRATARAIYREINRFVKKIKKNEIFFVYFSGHGGMRDHNGSTFVYSSDGVTIKRSQLQLEVNRAESRLNLLITDNGSKYIPAPLSVRSGSVMSDREKVKAYMNLFYNYKGMLHISAASEGEEAHPSFFTQSLFDETLMESPKLTWEENFNIVKSKTVEKAKGIGKRQTPKSYSLPVFYKKASINRIPKVKSTIDKSIKLSVKSSGAYYADGEVLHYVKSKHKKSINFAILGDGYTKADLEKGGNYEKECKRLADYIFTVSPFKEYKEFFNVFIVFIRSKDKGADDSPRKNTKDTALDATYGVGGIQRLLVAMNSKMANYFARKSGAKIDSIIVSVNDKRHGGAGGYLATSAKSRLSPKIVLHELGHTFGRLADEYVDERIKNRYPISGVKYRPNVDTEKDPKRVKWAKFIGKKGFEKTGVYEGGYYRKHGVYRAQKSCVMGGWGKEFCAPCQEALVKRIAQLAGFKYSFNDFVLRKQGKKTVVKIIDKKKEDVSEKPKVSVGYMSIGKCQGSTVCVKVENINVKNMRNRKISFFSALYQKGKWLPNSVIAFRSQIVKANSVNWKGPLKFRYRPAYLTRGDIKDKFWAVFFVKDRTSNKIIKRVEKPFYYNGKTEQIQVADFLKGSMSGPKLTGGMKYKSNGAIYSKYITVFKGKYKFQRMGVISKRGGNMSFTFSGKNNFFMKLAGVPNSEGKSQSYIDVYVNGFKLKRNLWLQKKWSYYHIPKNRFKIGKNSVRIVSVNKTAARFNRVWASSYLYRRSKEIR